MTGCIGRTTPAGTRIGSDEDVALALLAEGGVAPVHGGAFLDPGHFQLSFAAADHMLGRACARIRRFCEGLR